MRACVHCGLSIGESATFCPVCGARFDAVAVAGLETELVATSSVRPEVAPGSVFDADPDPTPAELVVDLAAAPATDPAAAAEILDPDGVAGGAVPRDVQPLAAGGETGAAAEVSRAAPPETPPGSGDCDDGHAEARDVEAVTVLLDRAAACEDTDAGRAAMLYGDAVVACLGMSEDPLGAGSVRGELLRGFDRLSYVLAREGLWAEALAVVEDAASLGLLDGANGVHAERRGALLDRRKDLNRIVNGTGFSS